MRAVEHDPTDDAAIDGLLRAAVPAGRVAEVEQLLRRLTRQQPGNTAAAVGLSRMLAGSGNYVEAAQVVQGALAGRAPDVRSLEQLASIFADAGDEQRLAGAVADLQRIAPQQASTLYFSAVLRLMAGRPDEAAALAERLRAGGLARARDLNLLGAAYASLGRTDEARGAFKAAIEADPRDPTAHENLGAFEFQAGNARAAAGHYADALTVDPASASARQGLADALRAVR
jgi:tetratricopeptide (TPR) repeat protein